MVICLCLSIGLGCLTLLMFGFGVFGISLRLWVINLPYFAAMAIGGRLIWRDRAQLAPLRLWPETWERRSIWLMCAAIAQPKHRHYHRLDRRGSLDRAGALISIQFKDELLADPFMSHAAKATIVRPAERES